MLLSRSAVLLTFVALLSSQVPPILCAQGSIEQSAEETTLHDTRPANCRVTLPSDGVFEAPSTVSVRPSRTPDRFFFGSEGLWTVLPADGTLRGSGPEKPGDFAYHDKFFWFRTHAPFLEQDGPISLRGKRLDGPAPSFIETYDGISTNPGQDGNAMIVMGMDVPVFGCWEFTGHYKDQDVTFTIWVTSYTEQEKSLYALALALRSSPARKEIVRRVHLDPEVQAKKLVYRVLPETPPAARATNASGTVVLHAVIGTDGRAHELSYVSGPPILAQAAIEAVRWWQYWINVVSLEPFEAQEVDTAISVLFSPP
jgi:Gram-negative bacterial TonB protein C-terminal